MQASIAKLLKRPEPSGPGRSRPLTNALYVVFSSATSPYCPRSVSTPVALSPGHPQQVTEGSLPIEHAGVTDRADWGSLMPPADRADAGLGAAKDARPFRLLQPHDGEVAHGGNHTVMAGVMPATPTGACWPA